MKVTKPQRLGLLHRTYERTVEGRARPFMGVAVLALISLEEPPEEGEEEAESEAHLLPEPELWALAAEELGPDGILDLGIPKARSEMLVVGEACAPGEKEVRELRVRASVGALQKSLIVHGERFWEEGLPGLPARFTRARLGWEIAFGGESFGPNPVGIGVHAGEENSASWPGGEASSSGLGRDTEDEEMQQTDRLDLRRTSLSDMEAAGDTRAEEMLATQRIDLRTMQLDLSTARLDLGAPESGGVPGLAKGAPMPRLEHPGEPILSPDDRPRPAGLGPIPIHWEPRLAQAGTYDEAWLQKSYPAFAEDMGPGLFNQAPADQQQEAPFTGAEAYSLSNLHPSRPLIEGELPGYRARAFFHHPGEEELIEIPLSLRTLWLFPGRERAALIFHGEIAVEDEEARDVERLLIAAERIGQPRPIEHYQHVLELRLDPEEGDLFALDDAPLLPWGAAPEGPPLAEPSPLDQALRRKAEAEHREARAKVAALGLDPDALVPPLPSPRRVKEAELPKLVREAKEKESREREAIAARKEELRERLAAGGLELEDFTEPEGRPAGLSGPGRAAELAALAAAEEEARGEGDPPGPVTLLLADPAFAQRLAEADRAEREGYLREAHTRPPPSTPEEEAARLREEVIVAHREGRSLARRDLAGVDLSGLDLGGIDLREAFLEGASLAGARLVGAILEGAILAHADLSGSDLSGAHLARASLGEAKLVRATASPAGGVDLRGAVLVGADLSEARLPRAQLAKADLSEARLIRTDLRGAVAPSTLFSETTFEEVSLVSAELRGATFLRLQLLRCDLRSASLEGAGFLEVEGKGSRLFGARMSNARFVQGCDFSEAVFDAADLRCANLRGATLVGASFEGATLVGADLSEADLDHADLVGVKAEGARFHRANLRGARLAWSDLREALFTRADLCAADFAGANLFMADLSRAAHDPRTILEGTYLARARVRPLVEGSEEWR